MKNFLLNKYFLFVCCCLAVYLIFIFSDKAPTSRIVPDQTLNYAVNAAPPKKNPEIPVNFIGHRVSETVIANGTSNIQEEIVDKDHSSSIQHYIQKFSSELMMAIDLQEKFDTDEMDSATATESEKNLAYVFYQGMEWQEFLPQDISCKKNTCRVELAMLTPEKNSQLMELLSAQMMTNNIRFMYAIPVSLPVENKEIIYFIKKSTNSFTRSFTLE